MVQELTDHILRRLSLIKKLYQTAVESSDGDSISHAISILPLQDAVELFLGLIAEIHDVDARRFDFMSYWPELKKKGVEISGQISMKRLNAARVNLKHLGIIPDKDDLKEFFATTTTFFIENTENIFNVEFLNISMVYLIQNKDLIAILSDAECALRGGQLKESVEFSAAAFAKAKEKMPETKMVRNSLFSRMSLTRISPDLAELDREVLNVRKNINTIISKMELMSLGVDISEYDHFKSLTPRVSVAIAGNYVINWHINPQLNTTKVRYCLDFVIKFILLLEKNLKIKMMFIDELHDEDD